MIKKIIGGLALGLALFACSSNPSTAEPTPATPAHAKFLWKEGLEQSGTSLYVYCIDDKDLLYVTSYRDAITVVPQGCAHGEVK